MALKYPFLVLVYSSLIVALYLILKQKQLQQKKSIKGVIARVNEIKATNTFKKIEKRNAIIRKINFISFVLLVAGLTVISARPVATTEQPRENYGLDVMIVLDASGSMTDYFKQVGKSINNLVGDFKSDRLGMITFSGEAQSVLPLTDDYTEIRIIADYLENKHPSDFKYHYGYSVGSGTDIASGLTLASVKMNSKDKNRTKAVILISDGQQTTSSRDDPNGDQPISKESVRSAATLLSNKDIKIFALATPGDSIAESGDELLNDITKKTGGAVYKIDNPEATTRVFDKIDKQLRASIKSDAETVTYDDPLPWLLLSLFMLACFLISAGMLVKGGLL